MSSPTPSRWSGFAAALGGVLWVIKGGGIIVVASAAAVQLLPRPRGADGSVPSFERD